MAAPSVWFDAGEEVCIACGCPVRMHYREDRRFGGCGFAERVLQLRNRLAQQLAASLHDGHRKDKSQVRRLHAVQSAGVRTRATSENR